MRPSRYLAVSLLSLCLAGTRQVHAQDLQVGAPLPEGYTPASAKAVVQAFLAVGPKGEFESTARYTERQRAAVPDLVGQFLMFEVNSDGCEGLYWTIKYNADKEQFEAVWMLRGPSGDSKRQPSISLLLADGGFGTCASHKIGSYDGSNAYGAKRTITRYSDTTYGVYWRPDAIYGATTVKLAIPMAPEMAQKTAPNIRTYVLGRLSESPSLGLVDERERYYEPKVSDPNERLSKRYSLGLQDVTLIIVDAQSRQILWIQKQQTKDLP